MTDETDSPGETISQEDRRTIWPFLLAVGIFGVILAAVIISSLRSTGVPEGDRVAQAVQAFVAAHNVGDTDRERAAQCPGFDPARSPLAGQSGRVGLSSTDNVAVHGDQASVRVTVKPDKAPEKTGDWHLAKTTNGWKVCSNP